jgi:hypothetical protein
MIKPTADDVRKWSNELLDDHLRNCYPSSGYVCPDCSRINRRAFEAEAVEEGVVAAPLVEGWL